MWRELLDSARRPAKLVKSSGTVPAPAAVKHPLPRRLALALVATGAVGMTVTFAPRPADARADNPAAPRGLALQGTGSCASGSCHNAGSARGAAEPAGPMSEYT